MFIHAYQSYLFNKILSERIRKGLPLNETLIGDIVLPVDKNNLPDQKNLIMVEKSNQEKINKRIKENKAFVSGIVFGAETRFAEGEQGEIERKVVDEEGVKREDFIIPKMPELTSKGVRRNLLAPLRKLDYDIKDSTVTLNFELLKGSYATCLLREFMKSTGIMDY
jgi:tRNA pseudouridine13 synthase